MKRWTAIVLVFCMLVLTVSITTNAVSYTALNQFEYTCKDADTVLLTRYIGTEKTVIVPGSYEVDGQKMGVELVSSTVFAGNTDLAAVTIANDVCFENSTMTLLFAKCESLRNVKIEADTASVTDMSFLFYGCKALEKLDLSNFNTENVATMQAMFSHCESLKKLSGYEKWNTGSLRAIDYMFNRTEKLKSVDLSRWDLSHLENSGWCFQYCGASRILLPENLAVISAGFLNHAANYTGSSFVIPAGVQKIGYAHTIYDFATDDFSQFRVAEGNTFYKAVDGILYSADGTQMLAIPRGKTFPEGVYEIPEDITFMGELSFSRNYSVETVILPDSYQLQYIQRYAPEYILFEDTGNLNQGLNLHIAIYCYTGVKAYEVKESNPNYKSIDGVIYSKDGTALLAVPTRYEGFLDIPEGVVSWAQDAMWNAGDLTNTQLKNCTGIHVPASMTSISLDQLEKLNTLERKFSKFKITVHKDNPVYYVGQSGQLLQRHNLEGMQITVPENIVYNGQAQMPQPTLTHKGKTLKAGEDYTLSYFENINAGTGWMRITGHGDYFGMVDYPFTIEKAQPNYTSPEGLVAVYGQSLGEISLPEGFSWLQPELTVGEPGTNVFQASYTNKDPNYITLTNVDVSISVQPKKLTAQNVQIAIWQPWNGNPAQPAVQVVDNGSPISENEYVISYEDNINIGEAKAVLRDAPGGRYIVDATVVFLVMPEPFISIVVLTLLWCVTTGLTITRSKKGALSEKLPKTR